MPQRPTILIDAEINFIDRLIQAIGYLEKTALWPSFQMSSQAILSHFNNGHTYALYYDVRQQNFWSNLSIADQTVYYCPDAREVGIQNVSLDWNYETNNQSAYVYQVYDAEHPRNSLLEEEVVCVHERFHGFQIYTEQVFFVPDLLDYQSPYSGYNNLTNVALAYLEHDVLLNFLRKYQLDELKNYVALTHFRNDMMDTASIEHAKGVEIIEGSANYVGINAMDFNDSQYLQMVEYDRAFNGTCYLPNPAAVDNIFSCVSFFRNYLIGPAAGRALDFLNISNWKTRVTVKGESFSELLQEQFPMTQQEVETRVQQTIASNPQYNQTYAILENSLVPYYQARQSYQDYYLQLPGIQLQLFLPACANTRFLNQTATYIIDTNTAINVNFTAVYRCSDGSFDAHINKPVAFVTQKFTEDSTSSELTFKVHNHTSVIIDGDKTTIQQVIEAGKNISFDNLEVQGDTDLRADLPGVITDDLVISFAELAVFKDNRRISEAPHFMSRLSPPLIDPTNVVRSAAIQSATLFTTTTPTFFKPANHNTLAAPAARNNIMGLSIPDESGISPLIFGLIAFGGIGIALLSLLIYFLTKCSSKQKTTEKSAPSLRF